MLSSVHTMTQQVLEYHWSKINQNQETAQLSEVPKIVQNRSKSGRSLAPSLSIELERELDGHYESFVQVEVDLKSKDRV